jgi:hypothetical protein
MIERIQVCMRSIDDEHTFWYHSRTYALQDILLHWKADDPRDSSFSYVLQRSPLWTARRSETAATWWVESASVARTYTSPPDPSEHPPRCRKRKMLMPAGKMHADAA